MQMISFCCPSPGTSHLMPSQRKISALQAFEIETADDSGIVPHKKKDEDGPNVLADFSACMYKYEEEEAFEEAFNAMRSNVDTQTSLDSICCAMTIGFRYWSLVGQEGCEVQLPRRCSQTPPAAEGSWAPIVEGVVAVEEARWPRRAPRMAATLLPFQVSRAAPGHRRSRIPHRARQEEPLAVALLLVEFTISLLLAARDVWRHVNADIELKIEVEGQTVTVAAANLLESQLGADIKFEVGGEIIIAHRRVLSARSPVFAAMLFGYDNAIQFQEQAPGAVVRLEEMEGVVFRMLLHFAYTGSLPPELNTPALPARHPLHIENEGNMSEHLFVAADRYCMERLKLLCAINLCHHLGVNTAARILTLAKQHQSERLKRTCLKFLSIRRHLDAVAATEDMQHLSASCPSLMIDLLDMSVPR